MSTKNNIIIRSLISKADKIGYHLSPPEKDMYGRYECTIEEIATGVMSVTMNHRSEIDAAQTALSNVSIGTGVLDNIMTQKSNSYDFEGA